MADAARASGMKEEGILRDVIYAAVCTGTAGHLFCCVPRVRRWPMGLSLLRGTGDGLGSTDGIRRIGFIRFGEMPDDGFLRESADTADIWIRPARLRTGCQPRRTCIRRFRPSG
jgi:hypothetical protein